MFFRADILKPFTHKMFLHEGLWFLNFLLWTFQSLLRFSYSFLIKHSNKHRKRRSQANLILFLVLKCSRICRILAYKRGP